MKKLILTYGPDGITCSDFNVEEVVDRVILGLKNDENIIVSSSLIITAIRLRVIQEEINFNDIEIHYLNRDGFHVIGFNKYGEFTSHPYKFINEDHLYKIKIFNLSKLKLIWKKDSEIAKKYLKSIS